MSADWVAALPQSCDRLRDYQRQQVEDVHAAVLAGHRRLLVQLPTGGGKTHEIAAVTKAATDANLRVLILATRTRLVRQIHDRLADFGVAHGVIAAALKSLVDTTSSVQVASADTLYRRCLCDQRTPLPPADIVIFDEAHLCTASTRAAILAEYPQALLLGFTATPARRSGKPLSEQFDVLISGRSVLELIAAGQLVRPRIFNVPIVTGAQLDGLPKDQTRDYQQAALGSLMSAPKLVGDVVQNWLRIASGKRTLVFAIHKAHGASLVEQFARAGVPAELLTDDDDEESREAAVARLEKGETTIIVNCFLLSYGADLPAVECIVLARPTRSVVLYLQSVGRGLRPSPGKTDCIVIDHGHVVENLGLPTEDFGWSLAASSNVNDRAIEAAKSRAGSRESARTCPECRHMWLVSEEGSRCNCCGWEFKPIPKKVTAISAELTELGVSVNATSPHAPECIAFYTEALTWYARRWPDRWRDREKSGRWWAWNQLRERFDFPDEVGIPSRFWDMWPALTVSPKVSGWLQSSIIRWARRRTA